MIMFNLRKWCSGLSVVVMFLLFCPMDIRAENLIKNPGFEVDSNNDGIPDGWSVIGKGVKGIEFKISTDAHVLSQIAPQTFFIALLNAISISLPLSKKFTLLLNPKNSSINPCLPRS